MTTLSRRAVLALPLASAAAAALAGPARAQSPDAPDLVRALALEHEAVHTLPEIGARLDEATKEAVRAIDADHRRQRDRLVEEIRATGARPAPALPAYALPFPVVDRTTALDVLIALEEALVRAYSAAVATSERAGHRSLAAELMARCAAHQVELRYARERSVTTSVTFPGT